MSGVVVHADCAVAIRKANERAERAEAAIQRVRALAQRWIAEAPKVGGWGRNPAAQVLAAVDSTDPVEDAPMVNKITQADLTVAAALTNAPATVSVDFDDPPCGICGCMRHFCAADCDCCPEHRSDAGLPADGEERVDG